MMWIGSLIVVAVGYMLLVYAAKQGGFHKSLGTFIAWFAIIAGLVGSVCGFYKCMKWGSCPYKSGYHRHHPGDNQQPGKMMEEESEEESEGEE